MSKQNADKWSALSHAREALDEQLQAHDEYCFVDIGFDSGASGDDEPTLRVHVCGEPNADSYPQTVDGISVIVFSDRE